MPRGGNDIYLYEKYGTFRVRVYRKNTRYYLGMFPTYEDAFAARERFLNELDLHEPKKYTKRWFEEQADKQRLDFITRYSG